MIFEIFFRIFCFFLNIGPVGLTRNQPHKTGSFRGWAGADPAHPKVYYVQNVNSSSRSAYSRKGCRNGGRRSSGSLDKGVSVVIRRLNWLFRWCRWEERWPESITGKGRRILQRWERGRNDECFWRGGGWLVVGIATYGGSGGGEAGGGWNGGEREGEKNCRNRGRRAGFWPTFNPIFSFFRSSTEPVFISGGRG